MAGVLVHKVKVALLVKVAVKEVKKVTMLVAVQGVIRVKVVKAGVRAQVMRVLVVAVVVAVVGVYKTVVFAVEYIGGLVVE
jgi:hypothetical protein